VNWTLIGEIASVAFGLAITGVVLYFVGMYLWVLIQLLIHVPGSRVVVAMFAVMAALVGASIHFHWGEGGGGYSPGPTAECNDGTYSYSQQHSGTCSWHGGVSTWLDSESSSYTYTPPKPKTQPAVKREWLYVCGDQTKVPLTARQPCADHGGVWDKEYTPVPKKRTLAEIREQQYYRREACVRQVMDGRVGGERLLQAGLWCASHGR
jgi:hypothetical protein